MKASLEEAEQRDGKPQILDLSQQISSFTQADFQWVSAICNRNNQDSQGSQSSVLEHIRTRRAGLQPWASRGLSISSPSPHPGLNLTYIYLGFFPPVPIPNLCPHLFHFKQLPLWPPFRPKGVHAGAARMN